MKWSKLIIISLIAVLFVGCNNGKNIELSEEQNERNKQTLWEVLDKEGNEKTMLSNDDDNVKEIVKLIQNHCSIIDNRNYKVLNVDAEYKYYDNNFIIALDNNNYKKSVENMYKTNDLILEQEDIIWYKNYFNEDITKCKLTIESEFKIIEANKEYLEKNEMNLDEIYQEKRVYYLVKDDNNWKISNIEKGTLTKRNSTI